MKNKWTSKATICFMMFGTAILCVVGFLVFVMLTSPEKNNELVKINKGAMFFDEKSMQIVCEEPGSVISSWTGDYIFVSDSKQKISLGKNTVIVDQNKYYIIGGGYKIQKDASVIKLGEFYETNATEAQFYKLADRKYLMIASVITDDQEIINTSNFVYVLLDRQGNAQILNTEVSAKTQVPTILNGDDITFDIANELFNFGETLSVDMKDIIGTTNTFDPMTYKNPLTEETNLNPEEIDIDVKGGNGGEGGEGGSGGEGGTGGSGGTGGTGGTGGKGSSGEQSDIVKQIMLLGVDRGSTYLNVSYYANDPFAQYGLIYIALYDPSKDLTNEEQRKQYIANQLYSVNIYQNEMTFYNLDPDTNYQVAIGHITDGEEEWFTDDLIKTTTLSISNSVKLYSQTADKLYFKINLDKFYDDYKIGKVILSKNNLERTDSSCNYRLGRFNSNNDNFKISNATSSDGVIVEVDYDVNNLKQSDIIYTEILISKLDEFDPDNLTTDTIKVLTNTTTNSYYDGSSCTSYYNLKVYTGLKTASSDTGSPIFNNSLPSGSNYILPNAPTTDRFGKRFVGWKKVGEDTVYNAGDSILINSEMTFMGVWDCASDTTLNNTNYECECNSGTIFNQESNSCTIPTATNTNTNTGTSSVGGNGV